MKILLVDDSKSARYALRLQLQRHGVEVDTADCAESAFEVLKGALPDAIMMDHMMPGLNGFEALEVIRKDPRTAHLPVVMCTSHEEPDFVAAARRKGVVGVLPKSTAPEKLPEILAQLRATMASGGTVTPATSAPVAAAPEIPQAAPAAEPPMPTEAKIVDLIDTRLGGVLEQAIGERIEARLSKLLTPLLDDLRRDLGERLSVETRRLVEENNADTLSKIDSLAAETRLLMDAGLSEAREAQAAARHAEAPEAYEAVAKRIVGETLPQMIRIEMETERGKAMDLVERYLRERLASAPTYSAPPSEEALATLEGVAVSKAVDAARRDTRETVEPLLEQINRTISDSVRARIRAGLTGVYMAIAGAALLGVAAAGIVFALLR